MAPLTIAQHLGMLEEDPESAPALVALRETIASGDRARMGDDAARLIEASRKNHDARAEHAVAAALLELELKLAAADPDREATLLKELGRLRREELLDDAGARTAYERVLVLRPGDEDAQEAIEQIDQISEKWKEITQHFIDEAEAASDATLKTSLLVRAATLVWQHKKRGREKEVDKLFADALAADPASTRAALLYAETLRVRERWDDMAKVLLDAGREAPSRDDKLHLFLRAARVLDRRLSDKVRAAQSYEQVLDFAPAHPEAMRFLSVHFTDTEQWDHLIALYEDSLRTQKRPEAEEGTLLQIGMVHWRMRQRPDAAEPYFARLRKIDPAHPAMLSFYRELYTAQGEEPKLLVILADAQRAVTEPARKLELAVEVARAAQRNPATLERAIDAWKAVQRLEPGNAEAPVALKDLYRRAEKWNALVEVLKAEIDALAGSNPTRKVEILREMIPIYRDRLQLDVMVINTYNAILQEEAGDRDALSALASTYEGMGRWNDLIQVLTRQAEAETDKGARVTLFLRVAALWIERFANYNQATRPLEQVLAADPQNLEAISKLKEIYSKKRAWKNLYDVLLREADLASDPTARIFNRVELAKLAGERLSLHSEAIQLWRNVLEEAPETPGALDALEKLAEREKDWPTQVEALERRLALTKDDKEKIRLLQKIGQLHTEQLHEPAKAASAWKRVLELDPKNGRALRTLRESYLAAGDWTSLEALYSETEDWEGLVDVLGGAADRATDPALKIELSFKTASIYAERIGEPHRAFRSYERILTADPTNVRAARALLPIYEKEEKWPKLTGLLEIVLRATPETEVADRLTILARLRLLSSDKLRDADGAFKWATQAYALAPTDKAVIEALESTADKAGAHGALVQTYTQRIEKAKEEEATKLRRRIAVIAAEKLGRSDVAVEQLERLVEDDLSDVAAVGALERLYRSTGKNLELRALYLRRIDQVKDATDRWMLLGELAQHEENVLGDKDSAASRYRAMLEIEPAEDDTLAQLDRLTTEAGRTKELVDIIRRRLALAKADRTGLLLRLGALLSDQLEDFPGARDAFAEALTRDAKRAEAITGLEKVADRAPALTVEIGRLLEPAYEASGANAKLIAVLRKRLEATTDVAERRELRLRLGELSVGTSRDHASAYDLYEAAALDAPGDLALWERLAVAAEHAGKQESLANAYATAIDLGGLPEGDAALLAGKLAVLYEDTLNSAERAEPHFRRVLAHEPLDERAFASLKELYTNKERWDDLQALYRNRVAETADASAKIELLMQVCFLFEEILDDPEVATRAYQDVLELEPTHVVARRALERLYTRTERWRDLAALLLGDVDDAEPADRIELACRIGELYEQKLGEPALAFEQYASVLAEQPHHMRAQAAMERLLSDPSQRQRAAGVLQGLYENQGAYAELSKVLEIQLEDLKDASSRASLLLRIAEIEEQRLKNVQAAFSAVSRAVAADPSDGGAREELGRLASMRGADPERAKVLEAAIAASEGSQALQAELVLELARLLDERIGDLDRAERAYEMLIEIEPSNADSVLAASLALERIHLGKGEHAKLAMDLRRQIKFQTDEQVRAQLLVRLGDLLEQYLDDVEGAIAAHRERLDIDSGDVDALRALERLLERKGDWQRLIGTLQSRDRVTDDQDERRRIALRMAEIYEEKLGERDNAIVAYNEVLSSFGQDRATLASLARLYEASERWQDLLEALEADATLTEDPSERAHLRYRIGQIHHLRLDDKTRAIEAYAEVLETILSHEGAITALEACLADAQGEPRIAAARVLASRYEAQGAFERLVQVLQVLAESEDQTEKLRALRRAAEVADIGLGDPSRAFKILSTAVRGAISEPDLGTHLAHLDRLATTSGEYAAYVTLLRELVPDIMDGDLQVEAQLRIADAARRHLNDVDLAREYYGRILENNPEHAGALDALEEVNTAANDHRGLLDVLKRKADLAQSPELRRELLLRQARLGESTLGDVTQAIEAYERVLESSEDAEAYAGLERLYAQAERWVDLGLLYERELARDFGSPFEVRYKLGVVYLERLEDPRQALEHFRDALSLSPTHEPTIAALEKLVAPTELGAVAAELLEPVLLARMDWPKVIGALEARLAAESDVDARKKLLTRLAQIQEDQLEDLEAALETYGRLFREDLADEDVWDTLARLARSLDKWARLAAIYDSALAELSSDDASSAKLAVTLARIYADRTGDARKASELYRRALRFDPLDRSAFEAVEALYLKMGAHTDLLDLYKEQIEAAPNDGERIVLLQKSARIYETSLDDRGEAASAHRRVLELDPRDVVSLEALDALLGTLERYADLAEHLRHRVDVSGPGRAEIELKFRLAQLLDAKLNDRTGAIDLYEEIMRSEPIHVPTVHALEVLVQDPGPRLRIIEVLEPIYKKADQWKKLVAVYEALAEISDAEHRKVEILSEIGRLHEQRGADAARAFHAYARAFVVEPSNPTVRGELDRLAGLLGAWDALVAAYEKALEVTDDAVIKSELLGAIARVHDERRGDPRSAILTYERLLTHDPDDASPLDALEALHTMVGDWVGLVGVLTRKVERSLDPADRGDLLRRAGSVLEELIADRPKAIEMYKRAIDEDANDEVALESLDRLYVAADDPHALFEVLKRRIELAADASLRAELGLRLGELAETRLKQPSDAIEAYQRVVEDAAGERTAITALGRLFQAQEMWTDLLDNLRLQVAIAETEAERVRLTYRAGELLEKEMAELGEALAQYRDVIAIDPAHSDTIAALLRLSETEQHGEEASEVVEPLLRAVARHEDLAKLLERNAERKASPEDKAAELRRLALVHEEGRADKEAAFDALRRALIEEPGDARTIDELERLGAALDGWDKVADVFAARASSALEPSQARTLYLRLAAIAEIKLSDDARAIEAYGRAVEQVGDEDELLSALDRLYVRTQQWKELGDVLERRVAVSNDARLVADLLIRLGELRSERFGEKKQALDAFREVLDRDPAEARALAAVEKMLEDDKLAEEAVDVLDGAYRRTASVDKAASLYEVRVRLAESDSDKSRLLQDLARIWEAELGEFGKALDALRRAVLLDPSQSDLFIEVERLAGAAKTWESLRGLVEEAVQKKGLDADAVRDLNLRAASWYRDHLSDAASAEARLRAAIAADRESAEAYSQLLDLLREAARHTDVVEILRTWADVETVEEAKKERYREAARVAEGALSDVTTAAKCFEAVLDVDASDIVALDELVRIRTGEKRMNDVAVLLARRIDAEVDPAARAMLRRGQARIYEDELQLKDKAIEAYVALLDDDATDVGALDALERLYEATERWKDLSETLSRRLDLSDQKEERIRVRVRLARLAVQRFGKRADALEQLREILAEDPDNREALDESERLLAADEKWRDLVELVERRAGDSASRGDLEGELAALVRLGRIHEERLSDPTEAASVYERVLERAPRHEGALDALARLVRASKNSAQLADILEKLLEVREGAAVVATANELADVAERELSDPARAEAASRRGIAAAAASEDPATREEGRKLRERLKKALASREEHEKLAALLDEELSLVSEPTQKLGLLRQMATIYESKLADPARAALALERAAELAPDDRSILLPLSDLYVAAGRQADAVPVLERVVASFAGKRSKELATYHHRLGRAFEAMGDDASALAQYDAAFKIDLTSIPVLRDLGRICHRMGDLDRAQKTFRALLLQKLDPNAGVTKADIYFLLGDIAHKQGDKPKAISMLDRAIAEDREHKAAAELLASIKGG